MLVSNWCELDPETWTQTKNTLLCLKTWYLLQAACMKSVLQASRTVVRRKYWLLGMHTAWSRHGLYAKILRGHNTFCSNPSSTMVATHELRNDLL